MSLHARLLPVALAIAIAPLGVCAHASDQAGSSNQANTTGQPDKNRQQDENALPVRTLKVRGHAIEAEVASTDAQREQGLMYRTDMPADHGMLFVFEQPALYCFWMKNTTGGGSSAWPTCSPGMNTAIARRGRCRGRWR